MVRKILLISVGLLFAMGAAPVHAQEYADTATVTVSNTTPVPGETLIISGTGFPPGEEVVIDINPTLFTTSDANGEWSVSWTIPLDIALGTYTITATAGGVTATATFTVVAPDGVIVPDDAVSDLTVGTLPRTGSGSSDLARVGVVLLAVGGVAIAFAKRRTQREPDAAPTG